MIKREEYLKKIRPFIGKDIIKVITGIRRCGKSVLLNLIIEELKNKGVNKENIIFINFELIKYQDITTKKQLNELILNLTKNKTGKIYLFFDEIQEVTEWEKSINGFQAELDCDIYITGSNAKLLSGELATYLAGRYIEIKIYPFSFKELILLKQAQNLISSNLTNEEETSIFNEYLIYGGMPFIYNLDENERVKYLSDLYNSIILKDIIQKYPLRDIDLLNRLIKFLMYNIGHTFSAKSISKYLKNEKKIVSRDTIHNYLMKMEEACLINNCRREDFLGKKLLKFNEKYYLTDHSFRQSLIGNNKKDISQVIENIVYVELLRRDYIVTVGKINSYEIDFIAKKPGKTIYIQVTYLLNNESTIDREFRPLLEIKDNFPKYVLSLDNYDFSNNGIIHLNLKEFLKGDI